MLEIILLILKIIGIILLCVIGLVILILLIVSWVPIRYGADFSKYEKPDLSVYVTWFLKAVSFEFFLRNGSHGIQLKLLGKSLGGKKKEEAEEEKPPDTEEPAEKEPADNDTSEPASENETSVKDSSSEVSESVQEHPPDTENPSGAVKDDAEKAEETAVPDESAVPDEEEKKADEASESKAEGLDGDTAEPSPEENEEEEKEAVPLDERLDDLFNDLQEKYINLENQWEGIRDKYEFLTDRHAMREYRRILRNLRRILGHLLPSKLTGQLHYGFDSPALTGKVLAYYCASAPVHRYSLVPVPDFTTKVFEGEAHLKGRIFIGYIIIKVLAIALNRDVLYLLLNFRKHFRKSQEG